jgi:hypothetical protein
VLLESVLTATPLYMLSLYKLSIKIKKKLDSIRCQFFMARYLSKEEVCFDKLEMDLYAKTIGWVGSN